MPLTQYDFAVLRAAHAAYDYPPVVWSDAEGEVIQLDNTAEVETYIGNRLRSGVPAQVREGLASVLAWGFANAGYQLVRVQDFLNRVTDHQLAVASRVLRAAAADGTSASDCVLAIKRLGLPQFSQMAFISKIAMFLDPNRFPVLDSNIADLLVQLPPSHTLSDLTRYPTSIPVTHNNASVYQRWAHACREIAQAGAIGQGRAVDAERAFFRLVSEQRIAEAAAILARWP